MVSYTIIIVFEKRKSGMVQGDVMENESHNKDFIFFVFLINLDFGGLGRISDFSLIHCFRIIITCCLCV